MNAKQKLHQVQLQTWAARFQEQAASGLTAKAWCVENNFSIHTYNYWKHLLKQEYVDSVLPEIVPLSIAQPNPITDLPVSTSQPLLSPSCQSPDSRELHNTNSIHISIGDIHIDVGPSVSEERLLKLLKAVRHA